MYFYKAHLIIKLPLDPLGILWCLLQSTLLAFKFGSKTGPLEFAAKSSESLVAFEGFEM